MLIRSRAVGQALLGQTAGLPTAAVREWGMPRAEPVSNVAQLFGTKLLEYILGEKKKRGYSFRKHVRNCWRSSPRRCDGAVNPGDVLHG